MEVWIKSLKVDMQVRQQGIELEVRSKDGKERMGNCYATQEGLVWCKGKTKREHGVWVEWEEFMAVCATKESLKAAIRAANAM